MILFIFIYQTLEMHLPVIYHNTAFDRIFITLSEIHCSINNIIIYNLLGKEVLNLKDLDIMNYNNYLEIDLPILPNGYYFIRFICD